MDIKRGDGMRFRSRSHKQSEGKGVFAVLKIIKSATGAAIHGFGRVSHPSSFRHKASGSLTAEAALALPLCLGFLLLMGSLLRALSLCEAIDLSLCSAARRAAACSVSENGVKKTRAALFFYEELKAAHADLSLVRGGMAGIRVNLKEDGAETGIIRMEVSCRLRLPGLVLGYQGFPVRDSVCTRAWTGMPHHAGDEGGGQTGTAKDTGTVLVAENGVVYHKDEDCTYLQLSVQSVSADSVAARRNQYGSRYVPCEKCARGQPQGTVYITRQGEAWHTDRSCSGLKRSIRVVPEDHARGRGLHACPRCGR